MPISNKETGEALLHPRKPATYDKTPFMKCTVICSYKKEF